MEAEFIAALRADDGNEAAAVRCRPAGEPRNLREQGRESDQRALLGVPPRVELRNGERRALVALAPLLAQIPDLGRWPAADRSGLIAIIRAKGGDEYRFHRLLLRHRPLCRALTSLSMQHA